MIDHHAALIYTMVLVSAADREMTDAELRTIGEAVKYLPIFDDFDIDALPGIASDCAESLNKDDGVDDTMATIRKSLPKTLRETAYAIACDVAAADGNVKQQELRVLEVLRHELKIDRLTAAAIETGARARHMVL